MAKAQGETHEDGERARAAQARTGDDAAAVISQRMEDGIKIPAAVRASWDGIVWAEIEGEVLLEMNRDAGFQGRSEDAREEIEAHRTSVREWVERLRALRADLVENEIERRAHESGWTRIGRAGRKAMEDQRRYRERRTAGLCVRCPRGRVRPAADGQAMCEECAEHNRKTRKRLRRRKSERQRRKAARDSRQEGAEAGREEHRKGDGNRGAAGQ